MRDLIVDGVPLRDPLGEWGIDYTRSKMLPELERGHDSDPPYGFHGNPSDTPGEGYFGTSRETWVLNVFTKAALLALQGLFQRPELPCLSAPQRTLLNSDTVRIGATFNTAVDNIRTARMRMVGSPALERINEETARLTLIMENLNAFWMSSAHYSSARALLTSASVPISLDILMADSNAPVTEGQVRFKGPISAGGHIAVLDRGNPFRSIRYTATVALAANEFVVADLATMKARLRTTDTSWDLTTGTDVSHRVTSSGDGAFHLTQAPGANWPHAPWNYTATAVNNLATSAAGVELRLRRSYFG